MNVYFDPVQSLINCTKDNIQQMDPKAWIGRHVSSLDKQFVRPNSLVIFGALALTVIMVIAVAYRSIALHHESKNKELKVKNIELRQANTDLKDKVVKLEPLIKNVQSELNQLSTENNALKTVNDALSQKIGQLKDENSVLNTNREFLVGEMNNLLEKGNAIFEENQNLKTDNATIIERAGIKFEELSSAVETLTEEKSNLVKQNAALELKSKQAHDIAFTNMTRNNTEKNKKISEQEAQIKKLTEQLEQANKNNAQLATVGTSDNEVFNGMFGW